MKLRVIEIEMEDTTAANCADVIRTLLSTGSSVKPPAQPLVTAVLELSEPAAAQELEEEEDEEPRVARPKKAPQVKVTAQEKATRNAPGGGDTIGTRILEAIKKQGPMSSLELANALKLEPVQIYAPCSTMKAKGELESKLDDRDGTRRWFLAKA
jgi:hypothetical protein